MVIRYKHDVHTDGLEQLERLCKRMLMRLCGEMN